MDQGQRATYDLRIFRMMLVEGFSTEELMILAADVVGGDCELIFSALQGKEKIAYDLVGWCARHSKLDLLARLAREENAAIYQKYQAQLINKPDGNVEDLTVIDPSIQKVVGPSLSPQASPFLIAVVTKVEAQAVLKAFSVEARQARRVIMNKMYYQLDLCGEATVWMVQSEMGTATPGGALLTVRQAIQDLRPQAVILCGVACGLRPDQQQLGDILVARQLLYYEPMNNNDPVLHGDRTTASERLLDRFRSIDLDWSGPPAHFGLVLSGEKWIDDPAFRQWLLTIEPEAIGGEMEGAGLYAAARDSRVDWILVKAIGHWADGNKDETIQAAVAGNAAQFVRQALQLDKGNATPSEPSAKIKPEPEPHLGELSSVSPVIHQKVAEPQRPIRILFLAANPTDTPSLRLDEEVRAIDSALRSAEYRDRFDIKQHWAVRVIDIQGLLLRHKPDIVHFSGHGSGSGGIILQNEAGQSQPVPVRALSRLFAVLKDNVRCVVLNACYSAEQAAAIAEHIDCVIGMSSAIGDDAAISFAAAFYQGLGYGCNLKTAFELGCVQIDLENLDEQDTPKLMLKKPDANISG